MKKNLTLFLFGMVTIAAESQAQPVITSSITSFPVGTADSAYGASPTVLPGAGGAGVTWDMSTVPTVFAAKLTIVSPGGTPYAGTFSSATFCTKIEGATTSYNYTRQSAAGIETLSLTYAGAGVGTDFSPNPRLSVPFPFSYNDSKSDTFQSTTGGPDTVRLTYDGYGTLKTPFYTYPNVIRVKEDYGTSTSYSWYTVSPFALVMNYSSASNNYVITTTPVGSTGVRNTPVATQVTLSPNPVSGAAVLRAELAGGYNNAVIIITDVSGRLVKQVPVTTYETVISTDGLLPGLYFYMLRNGGVAVANGKLLVDKR